jgi:hypothetical protein
MLLKKDTMEKNAFWKRMLLEKNALKIFGKKEKKMGNQSPTGNKSPLGNKSPGNKSPLGNKSPRNNSQGNKSPPGNKSWEQQSFLTGQISNIQEQKSRDQKSG